jgi:hypothetical protein
MHWCHALSFIHQSEVDRRYRLVLSIVESFIRLRGVSYVVLCT